MRPSIVRVAVARDTFSRVATATALLLVAVSAPLVAQGGPGRSGTPIQAGEQCPPGMTEVRPRNCQAPTMPAPSILDYRPRNTLKTVEHKVPKAKFPAIDYHGHPTGQLSSPEGLEQLGDELDKLNVRVMVAANNVSGEQLKRQVALVQGSPRMKDRVRFLT
ncbi:MAG TPA: hypothetical protein VFV33_20750, partial [Gemmatimonadaceae bacterium]|nr:hypothetical protein [Gemmatimonadaceae bacterium]